MSIYIAEGGHSHGKQLNTLILLPALCAMALCLGSIASAAPTVTIAKPAVPLEWVGDINYNAFIKVYASDPNGIARIEFWVDDYNVNTYQGDMWIPQGETYYRYDWDVSALSPGYRDIHVIAYNNIGQYTDVMRVVKVKPSLTVTSVDFTDGHTLWDREEDEEITGPQWVHGEYPKPIAYTVGATMSYDVEVDWLYCMPPAHFKYVIDGAWTDYTTFYHHEGETYVGAGGSYDFSDPCTALSNVSSYMLCQSFKFYVRSSESSDWAYAGSLNSTALPVYLTFGAPIGPWGDTTTPRACWYNVIKQACDWLLESGVDYPNTTQGMLNARSRLAYDVYMSSGKSYNSDEYHCNDTGTYFNMFEFYNDDEGDCRDMSSYWVKLCNSIGLSGELRRINDIFDQGEYMITKDILAIGGHPSSDWDVYPWNFHQIGWYDNVFDPCVKLDPNNPRVPQNEDINGNYKDDLYSGFKDYIPYSPFYLLEVE